MITLILLLLCTTTTTTTSITLTLIHSIPYSGLRAARARTYHADETTHHADETDDTLYVTARVGGLFSFSLTSPYSPPFVFNKSTTCLEGQDMDPSNRYLALTDPCRGDVYVFDSVSWKVSTSLRLWPTSGALHVRWLNSTHLIISNPGRLWMGSTWGENTSSLSDGLVLVRLSADSTLSITGSVSSGHVNGTESLTLLPSSLHSVMLGGFRSNTMDVVDLNTLSITAERTDETWRQMVGVWDSCRDLALLGLWTDEGGLIALDKDLNELGRVVGLPYANRVKISPSRSYVAVPLETSHGGGFAIVNVTNVHDMNIEYILRSGVGSGVNDTVYALEWVDSNNLYVAATDGILRVYSLR